MILDDRLHEFRVAQDHARSETLFLCGDSMNLCRAHGESVREALARHLGTLEARARSLRMVLRGKDPEIAQRQIESRGCVRPTQLVLRPSTMNDDFKTVIGRLSFDTCRSVDNVEYPSAPTPEHLTPDLPNTPVVPDVPGEPLRPETIADPTDPGGDPEPRG